MLYYFFAASLSRTRDNLHNRRLSATTTVLEHSLVTRREENIRVLTLSISPQRVVTRLDKYSFVRRTVFPIPQARLVLNTISFCNSMHAVSHSTILAKSVSDSGPFATATYFGPE